MNQLTVGTACIAVVFGVVGLSWLVPGVLAKLASVVSDWWHEHYIDLDEWFWMRDER